MPFSHRQHRFGAWLHSREPQSSQNPDRPPMFRTSLSSLISIKHARKLAQHAAVASPSLATITKECEELYDIIEIELSTCNWE